MLSRLQSLSSCFAVYDLCLCAQAFFLHAAFAWAMLDVIATSVSFFIEHSKHISRGVLEREIEFHYPNLSEEIIVYCSDGLRSILAADSLIKMGYEDIKVIRDGFSGWKNSGGKICLA